MDRFAQILSNLTRDVIFDRTGLAGPFRIELTAAPPYIPPEVQAELLARRAEDSRPLLDVALREQLGLKLESAQVHVRVLVIDRVERPTEN